MPRQKIKIPWPEFGDSLRFALAGYQEDIENEISKEAQRTAARTRQDIRNAAPRKSGTYAKTWAVKKDVVDRRRPAFIVHATKPGYQLAHPLERPHRIANQYGDNWGKTAGQPHIQPAAEKNGVEFQRNVVQIIKKLS